MKTIFILFCSLLSATVIFAQPANDNCSNATLVIPNGTCYGGTTVNANDSWTGTVGCQSGNNHPEVWYTFVAIGTTLNVNITVGTLTGNIEFVLVASTGPCSGLTNAGSLCGVSPLTGSISGLQIGTTYYYTISSSTSSQGTFTTCVTNSTPPTLSGQDCSTAAILCDNSTFSQGTSNAGFGTQELNTTATCLATQERQSKWFKFSVGCSGTLGFTINPNVNTDDYDFALFDVTNGCPTPTTAAIACNYQGTAPPFNDFEGCTGISIYGSGGLVSQPGIQTNVPCAKDWANPGFQPYSFLNQSAGNTYNPLNVIAGNTYALLVDNFTQSNSGFTLTFEGTAIIGPDATFTYTAGGCGTYNFTKTCQTNNSTFLWQFGDGNTSTLQNPSYTYSTFGIFIITLQVKDALGCIATFSQTINIVATPLPTAPTPQTFCSNTNPTVANLTATGTSLQWYNVSTGGLPLAGTTALVSGTYYVSQTVSGCESGRTPVTVTIITTAVPIATSPQTFCSNTNPTVANLTATGTGLQWYNVATGGSALTGTTALVSGIYYVSQTVSGCESGRTPVTVTITATALPIATSPQTFCSNTSPTVANLTATGTNLQWYNVATGGSALAGTTALVSGTYYVSQTVSGCESGRTPVTVTITTTAVPIATSPQTFCSNTSPTVANLTATGTGLQWYNVATGGSPLTGTTVLVSGTYYVSQTVSGCESGRTPVTVTITTTAVPIATSPQTFCSNANPTVANLTATGTGLQWYNVATGGSPLTGTTVLVSGTYYVSQTVSGCESGRTPVTVTITTTAVPIATSPQTFCSNTNPTVSNLTATGTGLQWYNVATGGSPLTGTTVLVSGTYYVSQAVSGCESGRTPVTVTITTTAVPIATSPQTFCSNTNPTVSNLTATGTGLQWYNVATGGSALTGTTALVSGIYYVSQTVSGCESGRTPVTVTLISITASVSVVATSSSICSGGSVTFTATPTNGGSNPTYQWMINGVNVTGQTASTFITSNLANGNIVSVMMTSNDPCANPTTATSNPITITTTSVAPSVTITSSTTSICSGGSVTFTATPINGGSNPTYQWMINGANVAGQTTSTFTSSTLANGSTVTLVMTSNDPCASSATATSNLISITTTTSVIPSVSITSTTTSICSGGSVTFTATPINGGSNPTYQWMINGANVAGQTASTFTTSTLANGNIITVEMTSNDLCANPATATSNSIGITTTSVAPSVSITSTTTSICSGGSVTFTATPTNGGSSPTYQWMINGVNVAGQTASTFTTSSLSNGNAVSVMMTSNDPCASPANTTSNSINITTTIVTPSVSITSTTTSICSGSSVTFTATPTNGGPGPTYQWMINGVNVSGQTASTFTTTSLSSGNTLSVMMTSNDPCANSVTPVQSQSITITSGAPALIITNPSEVCAPTSVDLTAALITAGSQAGLVYTYWLDANATTPLTNPNTVMNAGTYYIKAQDAGGCFITKPVNVSIDQKINGIRYSDVTATANTPLQLNARNLGAGYLYSWSPLTGLNFSNIKDPVFINNMGLEYLISITSPAGCVTVDTLLVKMTPVVQFQTPNVFVPKAWSPNGDGHNDLLFPLLVNITELKYFRIYNRWGEKVFETNIQGKGWDGVYKGKPQVFDVFTWTMEAVGVDGKTIRRSGNAVLLR